MSVAAVVEPDLTRHDVHARLEELRAEMAKGQQRAHALESERHELRDTLLRIGGAIQVLEELLKSGEVERGS
ncbi:MAG TPA: hypothetical protein VHS03_13450 [Gaiellaceae bacterium]|nr:hypothetical protein [Gaiellaceae bacterium]